MNKIKLLKLQQKQLIDLQYDLYEEIKSTLMNKNIKYFDWYSGTSLAGEVTNVFFDHDGDLRLSIDNDIIIDFTEAIGIIYE